MLELRDIKKRYGWKKALDGVGLTVSPGEIVGLFGENGAGKTTLMKCALGLLSFDGQVLLDGERVTRRNIARLGFATCEHSFFPNLPAESHREFYRAHFPKWRDKRYTALMEFFGLPRHTAVGRLSTGQQNQLELILALSQGADYILMDEPFAGSDVFNREDFYKVLLGILEPEEAVLISTHLIAEVENFISRAVLIKDGQILGDVQVSDLEDREETLLSFVKTSYGYRAGRVADALEKLSGEEDGQG